MDKNKVLKLLNEIINEVNNESNNKLNYVDNLNTDNKLSTSVRELIVQQALKFNQTGVYRYGGSGYENILTTGVDCSGFVHAIFNHCGIKIERLSSSAYATCGKDKTVPDKGDLIFYGNPINHVAIYIGDGKIINHGSTPTKILDWQYKPVVKIKDLIGDK